MFSLQCYAPFNNKRCTNSTKDNKIHCPLHIKEGVKLYSRYKKICCIAESYDLESIEDMSSIQEKVTFLNKAYNIFISAYEARLKHRQRCISPECRDYGHDQQFILLQQKINICEQRLEYLYTLPIIEVEATEVEESKENNIFVLDPVILQQVTTFRQKRKEDERETNKIIAAYIKENGKILKHKNKMIDICYKDILIFTTGNYVYEHMICMLTMVTVLQIAKERGRYNNYYSIFNVNTPVIRSYTNIKDLFKDQHTGAIVSLCTGLVNYTEEVLYIFQIIASVWRQGNFNPKSCKFKYRFNEEGLTFSVVQ
jgi:hypothetical protein